MRPRKKATESKSKVPVIGLLVLLISPVLYVLSVGPVVWLQVNGYMPQSVEDVLEVFYIPLAWLVENSDLAELILWYYLGLFIDL